MIPPELEALINILLRGVHVTNSEKQAHEWASGIINLLRVAGYEIRGADEIERAEIDK